MFENLLRSFSPASFLSNLRGNVMSGGSRFADIVGKGVTKAQDIFQKATALPIIGNVIQKTFGDPVQEALNIGKNIEQSARRIFQKPLPKSDGYIPFNYPLD